MTNVRILVVDDDARSARRLAHMLREDGYEVEVAVDGAGAISRLSRSPLPEALVTDLQLSHADGGAVVRYARSLSPQIPVFVLTGYPDLASKLGIGMSPPPVVLTKPLAYDVLATALRGLGDDHHHRPK